MKRLRLRGCRRNSGEGICGKSEKQLYGGEKRIIFRLFIYRQDGGKDKEAVTIGEILMGKYELCEQIGEGASGIVYLAWDRHLERFVAVKEEKGRDSGLGAEMEMLKSLKHPMLPDVYDYFGEERRYLVMEYIKGESLHNYIRREGSVPEEQACQWAMQLLNLLSYLHSRKPAVIYRDLKPENIIICPDGGIRVVDFGTALPVCYDKRLEASLAGTPGYAAPEQLGEKSGAGTADERSDIYTFGATLYHMLTGYNPSMPPYGIRPVRVMNPALTKGIEQIVQKCTETAPSMRYQTVEEIGRDLQRRKTLCRRHNLGKEKILCGQGIGGRRKKPRYVIREVEKRIWLTEKKTTGLLGIAILIGMVFLGSLSMYAKLSVLAKIPVSENVLIAGSGEEGVLPVTLYNTKGQKLLIRSGSAYRPEGNLVLEFEEELFANEGMQELSVTLTDSKTGDKKERVIYIQGMEEERHSD